MSKVLTVCILAYNHGLQSQYERVLVFYSTSVLALIQYVCILVMVSHSTGMLHSIAYGLPQCMCVLAVFHSTCAYWSFFPTARVCASSFTVRVCTGYVVL